MAYTKFEYLDSQKLSDAANKLNTCLEEYKDAIAKISSSTNDLMATWHGSGKTAFEKDYTTIYRQLTDIGDIMYDLYGSLIDSDAIYVETDEEIAKSFTMGTMKE